MNTYKVRLKHDKGYITLQIKARSTDEAANRAMDIEKCPERAIQWIRLTKAV